MIIKEASQVGDPIIRAKAKPVTKVTSTETKKIVKDLIDSMRYHNLVGMAAPQIGISKRVFVTEIRATKLRKGRKLDSVRVFINPKITKLSKLKILDWEGCGSVAEAQLFSKVPRSKTIEVEAYNLEGKKFALVATDLLARIIQHETDHLNGVIFMDRITDTKTLMSRGEYLRIRR